MTASLRLDRYSLDPDLKDTSKWSTVNRDQLTKKQQLRFEKLEKVVTEYISGRTVKAICAEHQISRVEMIRIVRRCLAIHRDGNIWGFRALISHTHQKEYQRLTAVKINTKALNGGGAGALTQLFDKFPSVRELIVTLFLKKFKEGIVHESRIPLKSIHKRFLTACREVGLTAKDYPISQQYRGKTALWNFLRELANERAKETAFARYADGVAKKLTVGEVERPPHTPPRILRPVQVVEFDGHRVDASCIIKIPSPFGGFVNRVIERFWILVIIDVLTRCVLGYSISLKREYSQDDVLRCAKNAVTPWKPRALTIPGLKYPTDGGFPSSVYPKLQWTIWDEFKYDNAKAHLAAKTLQKLCSTLGCAPNAGPVEDPDKRPFDERFFLTFEENGLHRIPSTTGSNPRDPRRRNPEKAALKFEIFLHEIEELIDVMLAAYNGDPHSGIGYQTPLEYLGFLIQDEEKLHAIRKLPEAKHNNLRFLNLETSRIVRGNLKKGRRPYIDFENVRYKNPVLSRTPQLIGKRLTISVDPEDPRSITAFLPNGAELGILTARGVWGRTPHDLETRRAVSQLRRRKLIHYTDNDDPVHVYTDFLAAKAQKSKSAARQYAATERAIKAVPKLPKHKRNTGPKPRRTQSTETQSTQDLPKGFSF